MDGWRRDGNREARDTHARKHALRRCTLCVVDECVLYTLNRDSCDQICTLGQVVGHGIMSSFAFQNEVVLHGLRRLLQRRKQATSRGAVLMTLCQSNHEVRRAMVPWHWQRARGRLSVYP